MNYINKSLEKDMSQLLMKTEGYYGDSFTDEEVRHLIANYNHKELESVLSVETNLCRLPVIGFIKYLKEATVDWGLRDLKEMGYEELCAYYNITNSLRRAYRTGSMYSYHWEAFEAANGLSSRIDIPYEWEGLYNPRSTKYIPAK